MNRHQSLTSEQLQQHIRNGRHQRSQAFTTGLCRLLSWIASRLHLRADVEGCV